MQSDGKLGQSQLFLSQVADICFIQTEEYNGAMKTLRGSRAHIEYQVRIPQGALLFQMDGSGSMADYERTRPPPRGLRIVPGF